MNNSQVVSSIAEQILMQIRQAVNIAEFDRTYTAVITDKVGTDKYMVSYNGSDHLAKSKSTFATGDTVMVCSPCNNDANLFIVCKI